MLHIVNTCDENFEIRPWGGLMCFLGTKEAVECKGLCDSAVLHIKHGQCHDGHVHDDCDEIICVLSGKGCHSFWDDNGQQTDYIIEPGSVLYIAKNRYHRTQNLSVDNDLVLFIVNYFINTQSDKTVRGYISEADDAPIVYDFGSITPLITPATCGNAVTTGEFITLKEGGSFSGSSITNEDLVFVINGAGTISYEDASGKSEKLPYIEKALAFFHPGEQYTITADTAPMKLFHLKTR